MNRYFKALKRQDWQCTLFPDLNNVLHSCCIAHDYDCADAWCQKSKEMRKKADISLRNCANKAFPLMGEIMYIGVRLYNLYKKLRLKPEY